MRPDFRSDSSEGLYQGRARAEPVNYLNQKNHFEMSYLYIHSNTFYEIIFLNKIVFLKFTAFEFMTQHLKRRQ